MKVRDVMTSPAITVSPYATYGEIVHRLRQHGISFVPVVDASGHLLGVVTEADVALREAYGHDSGGLIPLGDGFGGHRSGWARKASARNARGLMDLVHGAVDVDDDLDDATRRMLRGRHRAVPVLKHGRVVGVVALRDVLGRFDRPARDLVRDIQCLLASRAYEEHRTNLGFRLRDGVVRLSGSIGGEHVRPLVDALLDIDGVVDVDVEELSVIGQAVHQTPIVKAGMSPGGDLCPITLQSALPV